MLLIGLFGHDCSARASKLLPNPTCRAHMPCASCAQVGVPIDAFIKSAMEGLDEGLDEVAVTDAGKKFRAVIDDEKFGKMFEMLQQH